MNSFKIGFISALLIACLGLGYFLYDKGIDNSITQSAGETLSSETKAIEKENSRLQTQKEQYLESIKDNTNKLSQDENNTLTNYYDELSDYKTKSAELDKEIQTAKADKERLLQYSSGLNGVSNLPTGDSETLADGTYLCPDNIAPGRYKLTGTGNFRVVDISSNKIVETQNLKILDGHSYTLNLSENTKLITEGEISKTPVN